MSSKIVVIGSTNMDMVVKSFHIPVPGETVLGGGFLMNPGGKGANQAVSVARLGGNVSFISKVGKDVFGRQASQAFEDEGIGVEGILYDNTLPTGVALITVDDIGENSIVVDPGANLNLTPDEVGKYLDKIPDIGIMLVQMEIPIETIKFAIQYASIYSIKVILNPAPAHVETHEVFAKIDIITPNVSEAEILTGIPVTNVESARKAAEHLYFNGVKNVVITMGAKGSVLLHRGGFYEIPALKVKAVDSTAAGDAFNGALAIAVAEGQDILSAVHFANQVASITTTRMGAQSSIPRRSDLMLEPVLIN